MIDSHCHLNVKDYADDVHEVLERARASGVHGVLVPGIDMASCRRAIEIADKESMVRVAVGIHPHEALGWGPEAEAEIRDLAGHPSVAALGEIGLDFYRDWCPEDAQRRAYAEQLRLACELDLPVIIHDRQAHEEVLGALEEPELEGLRGVLHCFSGGPRDAERALAAGFHISFTGSITYGKGKADRVLKKAPLSRLLLETDSPYMTPVPHRGKRNEPGFVPFVAEALAEKTESTLEEVIGATDRAAHELLGFPAASS